MANRRGVPRLFIDTWRWLALRDKRENKHEKIKDLYLDLRGKGYLFYTSDYVLGETFTLLFRRLRIEDAKESVNAIEKGIERGYIRSERNWGAPQTIEIRG